jgi:BMFP domain-containing protein YqiC
MTASGTRSIDNKDTQRILDFYEKISEKAAKEALARWRRDVDYLKAIRELTKGP